MTAVYFGQYENSIFILFQTTCACIFKIIFQPSNIIMYHIIKNILFFVDLQNISVARFLQSVINVLKLLYN